MVIDLYNHLFHVYFILLFKGFYYYDVSEEIYLWVVWLVALLVHIAYVDYRSENKNPILLREWIKKNEKLEEQVRKLEKLLKF